MTEWLQQHQLLLGWMAALSVVTFVVSLIAVPMLIVRIPPDYFARSSRQWATSDRHGLHPLQVLLVIGKNLLGCFFLMAGLIMLVLPGQGVLTILIGIGLLNFPGKFKIERWIASRKYILNSMNWLRARSGKAPLVIHHMKSS